MNETASGAQTTNQEFENAEKPRGAVSTRGNAATTCPSRMAQNPPHAGSIGRGTFLRTAALSAFTAVCLAGCALPKMTSDSTAPAEAMRVENLVVIEDSALAAMTTGALRQRGLPAKGRSPVDAGQWQPGALSGRTAVVHVAASYDLDGWPASAVANITSIPDGEQIAVVRLQNGWLLHQGSALDRLVRRDVAQVADELSNGIAQRIRVATR